MPPEHAGQKVNARVAFLQEDTQSAQPLQLSILQLTVCSRAVYSHKSPRRITRNIHLQDRASIMQHLLLEQCTSYYFGLLCRSAPKHPVHTLLPSSDQHAQEASKLQMDFRNALPSWQPSGFPLYADSLKEPYMFISPSYLSCSLNPILIGNSYKISAVRQKMDVHPRSMWAKSIPVETFQRHEVSRKYDVL
jgi:hypothetical protein